MFNQFKFVQYTDKFVGSGTFEVTLPVTNENMDLAKKDRFLWIEEDIAGIIQYIGSKDGDEYSISVKGQLLPCIFDWRYIYPCFSKTGKPHSLMEDLVTTICVNPSIQARKLSGLEVIPLVVEGSRSITYQKTGGSLLEALDGLAESSTLGYRLGFNPRNENKITFTVKVGSDRTKGNTKGNAPVIFSHTLNNIMNGEYLYNDENYRNVTIVVGEAVDSSQNDNENANRVNTIVGDTSSTGFYRKELYTDARDLQSEYYEGDTTKTMSTSDYLATLEQRGNEKLSEKCIEESYSADVLVNASTTFVYGKDYELGDIVTVYDEQLRVSVDATVTEMQVTYDSSGYSYTPVFGYGIPSILDRVKHIIK